LVRVNKTTEESMDFKAQRRKEALDLIGWTDQPLVTKEDVWAEWEHFIRTAYKNTSALGLAAMVAPEISDNTILKDMVKLGIEKKKPGGRPGVNNICRLYIYVGKIEYSLKSFAAEYKLPYPKVHYWKQILRLTDQEIVKRARGGK
jgi:hypothetical protein